MRCDRVVLAAACSLLALATTQSPARPADGSPGRWIQTEGSGVRYNHTSTLLPDGKVLVAGGCKSLDRAGICDKPAESVQIFDPGAESWSVVGTLKRSGHSAAALPNGDVMIWGGCRPVRNTFLLPGGSGDYGQICEEEDPFEIYKFRKSRLESVPHPAPFKGDLHNGSALVSFPRGPASLCGQTCGKVLALNPSSAGLFDPETRTWASAGPALLSPVGFARLLSNGKALVQGRWMYLYDPLTQSWQPSGLPARPLGQASSITSAPDGTLVVTGGFQFPGGGRVETVAHVDVFDPEGTSKTGPPVDPGLQPFTAGTQIRGSWRPAEPLRRARAGHTSVALEDGSILAIGGSELVPSSRTGKGSACVPADEEKRVSQCVVQTSERFVPSRPAQSRTEKLAAPRGTTSVHFSSVSRPRFTSTLLNDGRVLVVGGNRKSIAEIYTPKSTGPAKSEKKRQAAGPAFTAWRGFWPIVILMTALAVWASLSLSRRRRRKTPFG